MVKLLDPLGSGEARGKLGGTVYNTWRGIHYARSSSSPANPNSPRRLAARAITRQLTARWQLITDIERSWWNDYASSHPLVSWNTATKRLTGFNWFVRANFQRVSMSLSVLDTPPVDPAPPALTLFEASQNLAEIDLSWNLSVDLSSSRQKVDIWVSRPCSPGRAPKIQDCKRLAIVDGDDYGFVVPPLSPANYGFFARTLDSDSGLSSPWMMTTISFVPSGLILSGPLSPSHSESFGEGDWPWEDPDNALIVDSALAVSSPEYNETTNYLYLTDFGFNLPPSAVISGIVARAVLRADSTSLFYISLLSFNELVGSPETQTVFTSQPAPFVLGSTVSLWDTTLSISDINNSSFGIALIAIQSTGDESVLGIDGVELSIYYSI